MNIQSAIDFIKHNVAVFLLVVGMFLGTAGTVVVWLWNEYGDLQEQKIQFEQHKSEAAETLNKREMELQKRELVVGQTGTKNAEREKALEARELQYQHSSEQLKLDQQALIAEYGEKAAERQLQSLMSAFSAMGVDLNANPNCGGKAGLEMYNRAKSKYSEIVSFAQAHSLEKKYHDFFFQNQPSVTSFSCPQGMHIRSPAT